jgi:tetratricopeptide (TPR) repeat protein
MKDNSIYNEQIDRFIKGQMSTEEEQQFKKEIGQNPELKQQVREHLYLIRGIKQVKSQEEQKIIQKEQHAQKIIPLRRNWIRITSIAASIAVIMVLTGIEGSRLYYQHEIRQFAYNASVGVMTDFAAASRGTMDEETKAHLTDLFTNAQEGKDLPETIAELSQLYALTKDDYVDIEDDYAYQIGWFLAVAYINNKDYEKALEIISNLESEYPDNGQLKTLQNGILNIL